MIKTKRDTTHVPSPEPSALETLDDHGLFIQRSSPGRGNPEGPSRPPTTPHPGLASACQVRLQLAELAPRTGRNPPDPFLWQEGVPLSLVRCSSDPGLGP